MEVRGLGAVEYRSMTYRQPSASPFPPHLQIQPTSDGAVLYHLLYCSIYCWNNLHERRPTQLNSCYSRVNCILFRSLRPRASYFASFFFFFNLFIYFWLCWVFTAVRGLSPDAVSSGYSSLRCAGFSRRWLLLWRSMGSRRAGFSSCGAWAQLLRSMWNLPRPGLEPVSLQ